MRNHVTFMRCVTHLLTNCGRVKSDFLPDPVGGRPRPWAAAVELRGMSFFACRRPAYRERRFWPELPLTMKDRAQRLFRYKSCSLVILCAVSISSQQTIADCRPDLMPSTPSDQFVDQGDGTVFDAATGLSWKRCSEGQDWDGKDCTGLAEVHGWGQALVLVDELNNNGGYAGHQDWRLPNINELTTLVERACSEPAINTAVFPSTPAAVFWSATPSTSSGIEAWATSFKDGTDGPRNKGALHHVRLLRLGTR